MLCKFIAASPKCCSRRLGKTTLLLLPSHRHNLLHFFPRVQTKLPQPSNCSRRLPLVPCNRVEKQWPQIYLRNEKQNGGRACIDRRSNWQLNQSSRSFTLLELQKEAAKMACLPFRFEFRADFECNSDFFKMHRKASDLK